MLLVLLMLRKILATKVALPQQVIVGSADEEPEQPTGLATSDVAPAIAVAKLVKGKLKGRRVKVTLSAMPTQWHPHCSEFDGTGWAARVVSVRYGTASLQFLYGEWENDKEYYREADVMAWEPLV